MIWFDLSSSEILARLTQRGVDWAKARQMVRRRDSPDGAQAIDAVLG